MVQSHSFPVGIKKKPAYTTQLGRTYIGDSRELLSQMPDDSIDLVVTSPPFALLREKEYGNESQSEYVKWLSGFAEMVIKKIKDTGSFVLDLGGAYKRGVPCRSLYNFRVLLHFCDEIGFHLAQEFFWFNPSKLPSPIEWVNKRKIRAKDSVNTVWWFSKTEWPKADVRKVLAPYSARMKQLLVNPAGFYTPKKRPSGHDISGRFGKDNGGALPSNLLQIPNSDSNSKYMQFCNQIGVKRHPARFPEKFPEFFVNFLTDPGDLVVDIFSGSNTTGYVCEGLARRWLAFDFDSDYVAASSLRFAEAHTPTDELNKMYCAIKKGETIKVGRRVLQLNV